MVQIDVKNRDAAERWQGEVQELNTETQQILERLSKTLETVTTGAEGEIVTKISQLSTDTITATTQIIKGMKGLFDVVGQVISSFTGAIDQALTDMANATRNYFSH